METGIQVAAWVGGALILAILAGLVLRVRRVPLIRFGAAELFVGNHGYQPQSMAGISVTRYPATATGDVAPTSELNTNHPFALIRDRTGNIYVASDTGNEVSVYATGTVGRTLPMRRLQGLNTGIHRPTGLALGPDDSLYVAERGGPSVESAILRFAPGADGNVAPVAKIPSILPKPGITPALNTEIHTASGIAVDSFGRIYVIELSDEPILGGALGRLLIFEAGAQGDVAPDVIIMAGFSSPQQVALDVDENVYVSNRESNGMPAAITVFGPRPTANSTPTRTIISSDLDNPFGLTIDDRGTIYVANTGQDNVLVFSAGAAGNTLPVRKIEGASTRMIDPLGIAYRAYTLFRL